MRLIEKVWFHSHPAKWLVVPLLFPVTLLFSLLSAIRRFLYRTNVLKIEPTALPVVIVGNIGIGGNGKTPLTIYLVEQCLKAGIKVGVISRGYGGNATHYPYQVDGNSTARECGDEPFLLFNRCNIPVVIGADRIESAELLHQQGCELIIADDGLQHYRLARDIEIIVVDGKRQFGNGLLLPSGPLREGRWRLRTADYIVMNNSVNTHVVSQPELHKGNTKNSIAMTLKANKVCNLVTGEQLTIYDFLMLHKEVHAVAGIGDPQRFFDTLVQHQFDLVSQQGFVDHHEFTPDDFNQFLESGDHALIMTEKDAVKCLPFAKPHWWYLPVDASFDEEHILELVNDVIQLAKTNNAQ